MGKFSVTGAALAANSLADLRAAIPVSQTKYLLSFEVTKIGVVNYGGDTVNVTVNASLQDTYAKAFLWEGTYLLSTKRTPAGGRKFDQDMISSMVSSALQSISSKRSVGS